MVYDPQKHDRRSIRLRGYDYSQAGAYFVTICTQNRACLFGEITGGKMILNDAGRMVEKWYHELSNKFPDIQCDEYVVMPDHFHCIIVNVGLRSGTEGECARGGHTSGERARGEHARGGHTSDERTRGEHAGSPLPGVVQWFKTMTTNEYIRGVKQWGWPRFDGKLWQRNYWDHIVRNENDLRRIRKYIIDNPAKWGMGRDKNRGGRTLR